MALQATPLCEGDYGVSWIETPEDVPDKLPPAANGSRMAGDDHTGQADQQQAEIQADE